MAKCPPELARPGDAASCGAVDYLVTAHAIHFAEGRSWHALLLRGEEGERRLQVEPKVDRALLMEPTPPDQLSGRAVAAGTASISIDSLTGTAEGIVVDYRRTERENGQIGWWERWPADEKAYIGRWLDLWVLRVWSSVVDTEGADARE